MATPRHDDEQLLNGELARMLREHGLDAKAEQQTACWVGPLLRCLAGRVTTGREKTSG